MKYEKIIETVGDSCEIDAHGSTRAIETVLETLGERLPETERRHFADQLPKEFKAFVSKRPRSDNFGLEDFYTRIAAREGIRYAAAVKRARCVMATLRQAVSPGELEDIRDALPAEFGELFGEPPESPLSPSTERP